MVIELHLVDIQTNHSTDVARDSTLSNFITVKWVSLELNHQGNKWKWQILQQLYHSPWNCPQPWNDCLHTHRLCQSLPSQSWTLWSYNQKERKNKNKNSCIYIYIYIKNRNNILCNLVTICLIHCCHITQKVLKNNAITLFGYFWTCNIAVIFFLNTSVRVPCNKYHGI